MAEKRSTIEAVAQRFPDGREFFFADVRQVDGSNISVQCFFDRFEPRVDRALIVPGTVLSFDYEQSPRGWRALRPIAITAAGAVTNPVSSPTPATPIPPLTATSGPASANGLEWPDVELQFGDLIVGGTTEQLPVSVKLTLGGRPTSGWNVELTQEGFQVQRPKKPATNAQGTASFIAELHNGEPLVSFVAKVFHKTNPKKTREFSDVWHRAKAQTVAAPEPKPVPVIKFKRSFGSTEGMYQFDVEFVPGEGIHVQTDQDIRWRRRGEAAWNDKSHSFAADLSGKASIEMTLPDGARGLIVFVSGNVQSEPSYIQNDTGVQRTKPVP